MMLIIAFCAAYDLQIPMGLRTPFHFTQTGEQTSDGDNLQLLLIWAIFMFMIPSTLFPPVTSTYSLFSCYLKTIL